MPTILTTPSDRFENLPDYPFAPHYQTVGEGLRMHYVEEGAPDGPVVLLLHGEPSWSYLYRKMIPVLVAQGYRTIAPDLIGFGKSDKLAAQSDYTYTKHLAWLREFIDACDLQDIRLFCQDWGGLLGLRMLTEQPERFTHAVASNTTLPVGKGPVPEIFETWRNFAAHSPEFDIGRVIDLATTSELSEAVLAAYNAPFPSEEYKAAARIFPSLVPFREEDPEALPNRAAWQVLKAWEKPFLTVFGSEDRIMAGMDQLFQKNVPGAQGQAHQMLTAGHFIQEDKGEELAGIIADFYRT